MIPLRCLLLLIVLQVHLHSFDHAVASSSQEVHNVEKRSGRIQQDNAGNEFYIGFMNNYVKQAFRTSLVFNRSTILITTNNPLGAVVMIESEQGTSTLNVRQGSAVTKTIEGFRVQTPSDRRKGIKIKAEQVKQILVFGFNEELHSVDSFTALPCNHLPTVRVYEYYAVSVKTTTTTADFDGKYSAFLIVACSNNTNVTVTPSQSVTHPNNANRRLRAGESFSIPLQERETLYVQSRIDLTGSRIQSSAPISFFTGHECGNFPADIPECDHLVEQIPPTVTWGTQFIIAPTATRDANDYFKVVAAHDETNGKVACTASRDRDNQFEFTINDAGNFHVFRLPPRTFCYCEFDNPVLMVQFTPGSGADEADADPFMVIVPAISQYLSNITFSTASSIGTTFNDYINIFVPTTRRTSGELTILMDDEPIEDVVWALIPCFNTEGRACGWATQFPIEAGVHSIRNSNGEPLGVIVYGLSYLESYAHVGGLKLSVPGLDYDLTPTSYFVLTGDDICMPCQGQNEIPLATEDIQWSKDGEIVSETERVSLSRDGNLCVEDAVLSDAGNYMCHVSGIEFLSKLSVTSGIIVEPPTCGSPETGALIGIGRGPTYLNTSTQSLQICCRVQGPFHTITWLRNGNPIDRRQSGYQFGDDYMRYTGRLSTGCVTYTCQAQFHQEERRVLSESSEICIGNIKPPTMVNVTGETTVREHSSVSYQCVADGFPVPDKMWTAYRDRDDPLPINARDNGDGMLTIRDVTEIDGILDYCCDVGNNYGNVLSKCIRINVLIAPQLLKGATGSLLTVSIPFGPTLPFEAPLNYTIIIRQSIRIPETYNLYIQCRTIRGNPKPYISWYHGNETIEGEQYDIQDDGTLVIKNLTRKRDDGVYTCVAYTPDIGKDEAKSTVTVTVPPVVNRSDVVNNPGNCLDLTHDLFNVQRVGAEMCVRAGKPALLILQCKILDGIPKPTVKWLKDGRSIAGVLERISYIDASENLTLLLGSEAYGKSKREIEGNYTCVASNIAGTIAVSSYVTLFGDIPFSVARTDFVKRQADIYQQLHKTVSEHFPGVEDGDQHLMFLTSGKFLSYEDFDPGYKYDGSEESVLPQTMENIFDLVDIVPNGGSIAFDSYDAERLQETYSELIEMLQEAPSTVTQDEQRNIRQYLQSYTEDPATDTRIPRLSLYLLYKNTYYMTKIEVENLVDSQRKKLLGWEFTRWYERNIHSLQMKINDAYVKWEMYADKTEVEEKLEKLNLEDHMQEVNAARALLLASQRMSRFKDEKQYYLIKLYPDVWYKGLKNRVRQSVQQLEYKLSQLQTEIKLLELTAQYLEKDTQKRETLNELFPSLDPVYKLRRELYLANYVLEQIVKESEDMRYECLVTGNPLNCQVYWSMHEHIREQVLGNYTEFYWYVHTVESSLKHREYSIPAIYGTISEIQEQALHTRITLNFARSQLNEIAAEKASDDIDFFTDFMYTPSPSSLSNFDFKLPPSLIGRLVWYINPESTRLLPNALMDKYNLTINHLNTALTNVSVKLSKVNIHRRWFKSGLFGNKHLMVSPGVMVSPGDIHPPKLFRDTIKNTTYRLPLYPSSMLLATEIELTIDVPYVFHTLPTLIKLSYDPHVSGGFGPFSFGPLYRARAGNMMKFRVEVKESKIRLMIPGTQLIGYVCDVVPKHPINRVFSSRTPPIERVPPYRDSTPPPPTLSTFRPPPPPVATVRTPRSVDDVHNEHSTDSDFNQWLFSRKNSYPPLKEGLFHKDPNTEHQHSKQLPLRKGRLQAEGTTESLAMLITPTAPLNSMSTDIGVYYNSTF